MGFLLLYSLPLPSLVTDPTFSNLQDWEVLVLGKLKWDLAAVIAHDFLALILYRLSLPSDRQALVKKHAQTFLALCATGNKLQAYFCQIRKINTWVIGDCYMPYKICENYIPSELPVSIQKKC